jgi:hypothetical protein
MEDTSQKTQGIEALELLNIESQPMTASNSTSSNPAAVDMNIGVSVPYGTRSRNRNGTSRPNYAEDKELDLEFEAAVTGKESIGGRNKPARVDQGVTEVGRASNHSRNTIVESDPIGTTQSHYKEPIPGTSTFSANPATNASQSSKKRKAPGQPISVLGSDTQSRSNPQNLPASQTVTRKASMAYQITGFRDSNMLSFDGCRGGLKNQRLVADDGTILQINGK